ncbi:uncharacterized protein LOC118756773 [Rhagoletis pomonella]|uniref:uncharacterized protein LOC118756773 n=1 Tax=Rhagoletis pomonella TaxID=28610 RepID=UPI0017804EDE|nr:uncharacterized protein LOC118756773 [Rhagoletis pomonella]
MKNGRWCDLIELFWKSQLGVPVDYFSNTNTLRQFFMAWILFNYIMTAIYFAKVESIFVHPSYYPEMDRLDDLETLNVPIFGVRNMFTAIKPALKPHHWRAIEQRAVYLPLKFSSFQYGVPISERKHSRVAFLLRSETAKDLLVKTYDVERRRPRFHVIKERLLAMPQTYLLPKGSPFGYKFQQFESRVFESGLFDYWAMRGLQKDSVRSASLEEFRNDLPDDLNFEDNDVDDDGDADDVEKKVVLNLSILQGPFYLWGFGILFSFIGFVLEHVYANIWDVKHITDDEYFYDKLKSLHLVHELRIAMFKEFLRAKSRVVATAGYTGVDGLLASVCICSQLITNITALARIWFSWQTGFQIVPHISSSF